MAKAVNIERSIIINSPIDDVWKVSALEFEHIDRWDGNVKSSTLVESHVTSPTSVSGRVCQMYNGSQTIERITMFDEGAKTFTYEIVEGLPGFVLEARNSWKHETSGAKKTKLTMSLTMQVKGIVGTLMQVPMKSQMAKVLDKAQEELKHYIETGEPHPRKKKKLAKA